MAQPYDYSLNIPSPWRLLVKPLTSALLVKRLNTLEKIERLE
jgi:hypothetical protein